MGPLVHALTPLAVIICATVLAALHVIDSATAVAMIGVAGGVSVPLVSRAHSRETSSGPPPPPTA